MKILVVDYSMVKHIATYGVKKFQNQNAAFGHLNCIAQKMSEILYSLNTIHKPDTWVFAMDSKPYWRDGEMASFYRENTEFLSYEDNHYWKAYGCIFKNDEGSLKKCTKKEAAPILEASVPAWDSFEEIAQDFPLPKYKGQRKPIDYDWLDCEPKDYHEFMAKLPGLYAKLLGGCVVKHEGCEADDIAGVICSRANEKGNEVVLISGDSDWAQLPAYYPLVTWIDPFRDKRFDHSQKAEIIPKIWAKIIGGDSGDGIKGCAHTTAWGPIGETTAAKIVEEGTRSEVVDPKYLGHNQRMVVLKPERMPFDIVLKIESELKAKVRSDSDVSWDDLNLSDKQRKDLEIDSIAEGLWNSLV